MGVQPVMVQLARRVAVLLVLLSTGLGPGVLRGVGLPASPVTSPVEALDLAAMALNPVDLDAEGLSGFGQRSSALLASGEQAEHFVPGLGQDSAAVRAAIAAPSLVRRYESELGRAAHSSRLRTLRHLLSARVRLGRGSVRRLHSPFDRPHGFDETG